jgi:hypothetical protein
MRQKSADAPPPAGDLATAEAPALTYSVLAQLATGALLDTVASKTPPVCGKQLVGNGGFESGSSPWTATSGVRIGTAKATPAFPGKFLACLGGRTAPRKDTLSQTVTIKFASNETLKGHATSFLIDNVAVPVS